ncbi:MAG: hypothetical protein ACXABI_09825 [Candidatus Hodarchaeales archaeon]|jgi:hypothetical protein
MIDIITIILIGIVLVIVVIIARYFEIIPQFLINQIADRELVIDVPSELNLDADLVFTEINGGTQKAWFFSSR